MKVLVTGGAGFIGSNVVDLLIKEGHEVVIVDNLSTGKVENINPDARFYKCNITELNTLKIIFQIESPEVVIHNAAQIDIQTSLKKPDFDADTNIGGTINVLQCCKEYKVKKVIYPSSAAVYGNPLYLPVDENHPVDPISFYGISKHTPEHYIKTYAELYDIKYAIFRYANVYGIRQDPKGEGGVVSIFINKFLNHKAPVIYGDGMQTRDFIYVKDVARANLLALTKGDNEILNISTCKQTTVNKLFVVMREVFSSDLDVLHGEFRDGDIKDSYLDNKKARTFLKWISQYSLEDGLRETCMYYRERYRAEKEVAAANEF